MTAKIDNLYRDLSSAHEQTQILKDQLSKAGQNNYANQQQQQQNRQGVVGMTAQNMLQPSEQQQI